MLYDKRKPSLKDKLMGQAQEEQKTKKVETKKTNKTKNKK